MSSYFFIISNHPPLSYSVQTGQSVWWELRSSDTYDKDDDNFGWNSNWRSFILSLIQVVSGYYSHPFRIWVFCVCLSLIAFNLFFSSSFFPSNKNIKYVSPDRWSINIMELHKQSTGTTAHIEALFFLSRFICWCVECAKALYWNRHLRLSDDSPSPPPRPP
jgi:hypothetical protein